MESIFIYLILIALGLGSSDASSSFYVSNGGKWTFSYSPSPSASSSVQKGPLALPLLKVSGFVVVAEGKYDHEHHTHAGEKHHKPSPHFANANGTTSTKVYLGSTATLDCTVFDLTNESVSWLRRVGDVLELLTWDSYTYSKDDRYTLVQESGDKWQRWQLVIRNTVAKDQGQYRCQVSTQPPMVLSTILKVTKPRVQIVDERGTKVLEKHYNSGSMIELKCVVEHVPFPHAPVIWKRENRTLTFNTSIGGISIKGDPNAGYLRSRLYVANATPFHSGIYSCWYSNYSSDAVTVHVIAGENSAGLHHDAVPEQQANRGVSFYNMQSSHRSKGVSRERLLPFILCLFGLGLTSRIHGIWGQGPEAAWITIVCLCSVNRWFFPLVLCSIQLVIFGKVTSIFR